jgi:transcriptional regulator with XRE-family HTH domain
VSQSDVGCGQLGVIDGAAPSQHQRAAEDFGALVRAYRQRSGMTQAQLAEQCGLSWWFVSDVERGQVPGIEEWQERALPLVGVLGIPPEELTGLGVLDQAEARLLRLAGQAAASRSRATGQVRLSLSVAELGELAAVAAELAIQTQMTLATVAARRGEAPPAPGDEQAHQAAVLDAKTHVRWLLGMVGCWDFRLIPSAPPWGEGSFGETARAGRRQ